MKLVCFSNNTAGGLLCDLLNNKYNLTEGYKTGGKEHSILKISDTAGIELNIDIPKWESQVALYINNPIWAGTHQHPSVIPDLSKFEKVIAVTTTSRASKLYRWLRYYYGWYKSSHPDFIEDNSIESIDKIRELAKNIFVPFVPHKLCTNIEFSDIVNGSFVKDNNLNIDYFNQWQRNNPWLYNFNSYHWAINRFDEAEFELINDLPFKYI